ncbi:uncharacterized protein YaeQ [Azomonas agilis]|uniref:Uncharacterized protein YaeQ n=1 Tax=Azomonas agilis TaxID=116849 RepID=A0A562I1E1_9GAMM|nr:YaeQ family protein [Azomonas agilis]TWH64867.1 uncharacterized protein YaeQ [Azomonas agilis]
MALQATPYKVDCNLTDMDRGVYEHLRFTLARHPSETEERLGTRLIAYALWYSELLKFGRGLSDVDEAAVWEKSLDDRILHWIEVGQPDADRLQWCSRRTERLSLLMYGSTRVWQDRVLPNVKTLKNLSVAALDVEALAKLTQNLPRSIQWDIMLSDGTLFVTDEQGQHEIPLHWLLGARY